MTNDQIKYSIETEEVCLTLWQKIDHYLIVGFMFIFPMVFIYVQIENYFNEGSISLRFGEILFVLIPLLLAYLFYKLQKRRLKFTVLKTSLDREVLNKAIESVSNELEWKPFLVYKNVIVAKTYPSVLSGSWGEHITILFDKNRVLINSICDPDKISSLISMGRNKQNVDTLIQELKKVTPLTSVSSGLERGSDP